MECLLCRFRSEVSGLKDHYCNYYAIDSKDIHFLNLFKPDCLDDNKCYECFVNFQLVEKKRNHMFLAHYYNQKGGTRNNALTPLNVLKRGL